MKTILIACALLAGCAYQKETVTADSSQITIKAGHYANPGDEASKHCAQYGKKAVLVGNANDMYQFACE